MAPHRSGRVSPRRALRCLVTMRQTEAERRMQESEFSGALDAVYDAATSFDRWPVALGHFARAFDCSFVGLIHRDLRTMEGRAVALGIDAAGQKTPIPACVARPRFDAW